ncbi:MAG: hypothetical protein EBX09_07245, partial [Actinobacteria bacterium]|nr:hypothetical protein [Actinomycetota bacterium]
DEGDGGDVRVEVAATRRELQEQIALLVPGRFVSGEHSHFQHLAIKLGEEVPACCDGVCFHTLNVERLNPLARSGCAE